ncbi:flavodoxin family protein [Flavobacterium salilacus subsp. salilacus]|uniref:flavodoxin family protein n=1 Tax=Flavobacterium TaxID=237 RepID=UPI00107510AE|nr:MULTISPECIES: NAD(P)H-dependent oxidoreductase [Flavobacterium]KAF2519986.1 flavodoxin family protein [Flavobacterium salilacus subsp. salilacus]MBE1614100.1 flavodoxin family protein [Flavobacterium sp. SaA2.13]
MDTNFKGLKALYINCTLKKSPELSHTEGLMQLSVDIMKKEGVSVDMIRFVDFDVPPGVYPDMTEKGWDKDDWVTLSKQVLGADILIIGTPIWLGEKSSVTQKLIERLYSLSGEMNDKGQYIYYGRVGGCVITGNEDGIKHCARDILYALQHIGYSIPPQADCGWIGEAGPGPSYLDEESHAKENDFTNRNTAFMTYNLLHLAKMLKNNNGYPAYGNSRKDWDNGERWRFDNPEYR